MKIIHYIPANSSVQWGDNANPNTLVNTASPFRNFITAADTIDASGNILNSSNSGINQYNNGMVTAPVRLVANSGDTTFLSPSNIVSGWTIGTVLNGDPSLNNDMRVNSTQMYFSLNETVQKDGVDDYFEIVMSGLSSNLNTTIPSVIKANGVFSMNNFCVGFHFFSKTTKTFELVALNNSTPYGSVGVGGGVYSGQLNAKMFKCLTTKSFIRNYGANRNSLDVYNGIELFALQPERVAIDGIIDSSYYHFEINSSGIRADVTRSGTNATKILYSNIFNTIDGDIIIPIPTTWNSDQSGTDLPGGAYKKAEFYIS